MADRLEERARAWGVRVERTIDTASSLVAFGRSDTRPVVLKIVRAPGDEWRSGEALQAFGGRGVVRVLSHTPGAVLLERLVPGTPLADVALAGHDARATDVLADVIARMSPAPGDRAAFPTVEDWGRGFDRYLAGGDGRVPVRLVETGREVYHELCASQRDVRLLHGDLQHYNILHDDDRGWVAIDPKGVVGEIAFEVGASLRNPIDRFDLFATPRIIERRLGQLESSLRLDADRMLRWAFAQAVLSAIWTVEDGGDLDADDPAIRLADATAAMLGW